MKFIPIKQNYYSDDTEADLNYRLACCLQEKHNPVCNELYAWVTGMKKNVPELGLMVIINDKDVKVIELNCLDYPQALAGKYTERHHDRAQDVVFRYWGKSCNGDGSKIIPLLFVDMEPQDIAITKEQVKLQIFNFTRSVMFLLPEPEPEAKSAAEDALEKAKALLAAPEGLAEMPEIHIKTAQELGWSTKDADTAAVKEERTLIFGDKELTPNCIVKEITSWDKLNAINFNRFLFGHEKNCSMLIPNLFCSIGIIPSTRLTPDNIAAILSLCCSIARNKDTYIKRIHNDDFYNEILQGLTPEVKPEVKPDISVSELSKRLKIGHSFVSAYCNCDRFRYHTAPNNGQRRFTQEEADYNMEQLRKMREKEQLRKAQENGGKTDDI